jgi:hypothetical protein
MARRNMNTPTPSPRTAPAPHERAGTLWGKLAESVFSYALSFVLGTMLLGGAGYLLFNARSEELALESKKLHFDASTKDVAMAYEMSALYKSSGSEPLLKTGAVVDRLYDSVVAAKRLDDAFVRETSIWIGESVSRKAEQIGRINGYTFSAELYKDLQRDYVGELDAEKKLLSDVAEMVNDWDKLSVERRKERIGRALNKALEIRTVQAQIESRRSQVMMDLDEKMKEGKQKSNEINNQLTIITRRKRMAKIGIVVGTAFILTTIAMSLYTKFLKRSST